jgi:hypothetical protein
MTSHYVAMKLLVCFLSLLAVASAAGKKFPTPKPFSGVVDHGNYEKIRDIFGQSSVLSVLLKNYEQPEGVVTWLEGIFGRNNKSFVIHAIESFDYHDEWVERCIEYQSDPAKRTTYYERMYQQTHQNVEKTHNIHSFDDFEQESDPQAPVVLATPVKVEKIHENFADGLDRWWKFYYGGYIFFTPFETLDYFIGCLVNRAGTFLIIIDEDASESGESLPQIMNATFHRMWAKSTNLKVHILVNGTIFAFDPFAKTESGFGSVKTFESLTTEEDLKTVNGYPIYLDIFWSAFSISTDNFTSLKLSKLKGPDIDVARIIGEQMNATSN